MIAISSSVRNLVIERIKILQQESTPQLSHTHPVTHNMYTQNNEQENHAKHRSVQDNKHEKHEMKK